MSHPLSTITTASLIDRLDDWTGSDMGLSNRRRQLLDDTIERLQQLEAARVAALLVVGLDGTSCQCQGESCTSCGVRKALKRGMP